MLEKIKQNYEKYRWFFTSSGKLVIGGKSSSQNEKLVKKIVKLEEELLMMHTEKPGSPFSVILSPIDDLNEKDLEETAIFTACFSQQWKKGGENAKVNVFTSNQIEKRGDMKEGTFGVRGKKKGQKVKLKLYFGEQEDKLRAIPFKNDDIFITPGSIEKKKAAEMIANRLDLDEQEVIRALPAGGFNIHF